MADKFVIANKSSRPKRRVARKGSANQLRIIGGQWRSRRLPVASVPGLRPTPDRVRETLFNWLQAEIVGASCLDLFAGSGALGLEALSRDAAKVVFVENNVAAVRQLQVNLTSLQADMAQAQVLHRDAVSFLKHETQAFDVIFLDPPFQQNWLECILDLIVAGALLHANTVIYLEYERHYSLNLARWGLEVYRETQAGEVCSCLVRRLPSC